jgi:hypothetical protein
VEPDPKAVQVSSAETKDDPEAPTTKPDEKAAVSTEPAPAQDPPAIESKPDDASKSDSEGTEQSTALETPGNGVKQPLDQTQHQTIYRLLDGALQEAPPPKSTPEGGRAYVHPILLDMVLAIGLLVAMAGFTIGLLKIYITHSAEQSITQRNFKAAIAILRGAPLPGWFTVPGKDPQELLNQALYLEAMEKLDANSEDEAALHELSEIQPGSKFFEFAQEIVKDHTIPSSVQLEGSAQHEASPNDPVVEDPNPVLPPEEKQGSP